MEYNFIKIKNIKEKVLKSIEGKGSNECQKPDR